METYTNLRKMALCSKHKWLSELLSLISPGVLKRQTHISSNRVRRRATSLYITLQIFNVASLKTAKTTGKVQVTT